ncbi:hypothetical protein [Nocardia spumae]|uniref:hypothetical protein n=1 Tax=Nocardia spumae TaxID=2887190 RepID=UPI001D134A90|nr:hypothetical protein [Nocardia spumae]
MTAKAVALLAPAPPPPRWASARQIGQRAAARASQCRSPDAHLVIDGGKTAHA